MIINKLKKNLSLIHPEILLKINNDVHGLLKNEKYSTRAVVYRILDDNITKSCYCFLLNNHLDDKDLNDIDELIIEVRNVLVERNVETLKNHKIMQIITEELKNFSEEKDLE